MSRNKQKHKGRDSNRDEMYISMDICMEMSLYFCYILPYTCSVHFQGSRSKHLRVLLLSRIPYTILSMLYGFNYNVQVPGKIGVYKRGKNKDKLHCRSVWVFNFPYFKVPYPYHITFFSLTLPTVNMLFCAFR